MTETPTKKPSGSAGRDALEVVTLWSLAVAQPIYDLLSRGAEFLLAHQLRAADVVVLAVTLSFLLPALLWIAERLVAAVGVRPHSLAIAGLAAVIALLALRGQPAVVTLIAALAFGGLCAWAIHRFATARSFIAILSPAAVIFPALFLLRPPVSGLLFTPDVDTAGAAGVASTTPVVFVVLDELPTSSLMGPDRRIDAGRYPAFADLAGHGHWFRNATSVAEGTTYAVPAILTGRYPDRPRAAHVSAYPENLFTWLGDAYSMNVFESLTRLCPEDYQQATGMEEGFVDRMRSTFTDLGLVYLHRLLPERLAARLPAVTSTWRDFGDGVSESPEVDAPDPQKRRGASAQVFERFIESIRPTRRPVLHFLHVNLPHLPWKYLPSGKEYGPMDARQMPQGLRGEKWGDDPWATVQGYQRHLLQLAYTDRLLGRLFERLRATELYDRSLIVVTADHGASFWPGASRREATEENRADILVVPLLVKTPFQSQGMVSDRNVETVDILPTIADVLGSPLPWPVDGRSMLDDSLPPRSEKTFIDAAGHEIIGRVALEAPLDAAGATLERKLSLFGSQADPQALFHIGRYRDLIGRPPAELPVAPGSGLEVALSDARILEDLDPGDRYAPARIVGSLGPAAGNVLDLAVAVNGRIRAVTETYVDLDGDLELAAMVPEESFREGFNQVEIFEILSGDAGPHLALIPSKMVLHFELELGAGGSVERIVASDGRSFRVEENGLEGEAVFDGVSFTGWAADVENARIADSVLLFKGRELISRVRTGGFRRDVAERYESPALARVGFSFVVPYSTVDPDSPEIRFFAVLDDVATLLPYRDAWTAAPK